MKKSFWAILFPAAAFLVLMAAAAGCGSDGNGQDATEDQQADVPHDPAADETAGDPATDDVSTDPRPDDVPAEDQSGEVPHPDVAPDPTDTPAEDVTEEDVTYPACADAGGVCTQWRWIMCEAGQEPIDPDPNRDCPGSEGTRGWCCVDAPTSTCSDSGEGNCVAATSCAGCWGPAREGLSCEEGRVCCVDICD